VTSPTLLQAAVEGDLDEAVLRRAAQHVGADLSHVYGREGKPRLRASIAGYNNAARHGPRAVLVDLDDDHDCAVLLRREWLPSQAPLMCFRVAARQVESWLLAHREGIAGFLGVSRSVVPQNPDALPNAKRAMVHLAERSNRREIRETLPPAPGSGRSVGVLYNARLRVFVEQRWQPELAAQRSDSLRRCLDGLAALKALC
jgi:hypothetical protein